MKFLIWQLIHGRINTSESPLVGPFCYILCWRRRKAMITYFLIVLACFRFGTSSWRCLTYQLAMHIDFSVMMIKEFIFHRRAYERLGCMFRWQSIWGERNSRIFQGVERKPFNVLSWANFNVFHWVSVESYFCNYSLGLILLDWIPFF